MDAVSDRRIHTIVFKKSAQVGATEILLNITGYFIHQDPSPMLLLQPTGNMALAFSKDRLTPMCRDSPVLAGKLMTASNPETSHRATRKGSTLLQKVFPGGHISMAGMNAPSELASRPVRVVLIDEVDRAPINVGGAESGEGDPVSLARKRSQTFWNRKTILVSTPTIEGMSRIDAEFEESDKRLYFVPCPHCDHKQILEWKFVIWPEDEPHKAEYACCECGVLWDDIERWDTIKHGEWTPTQPDKLGIAGFHINELYSPWSKLGHVATEFVIAKRNGPEQLKTWVNTSLGECWRDDEGESFDWKTLHARREHYRHGDQVPAEALVLVAGVDVQDDRIEYEVIAYTQFEESYGIEYKILQGDPGRPDIWKRLHESLTREFEVAEGCGDPMTISMACIDSGGHYTDAVYEFCRKYGRFKFVPIKGGSEAGKPIARYPRRPGKENRVYLTLVGTDTAKELIYSRYRITDPGPGYCHYPVSDDYNDIYFQQATAEKRIRRYVKGQEKFVWESRNKRNEALDCRVYALVALRILQQHRGLRLNKGNSLAKLQDKDEAESVPRRSSPRPKKKPSKGWVNYEGSWI